jgi:hypothetical protein
MTEPRKGYEPDLRLGRREDLIRVLELMPEEAFSYFVTWAAGADVQFPEDDLGGFQHESQDAIVALRGAARAYLKHAIEP